MIDRWARRLMNNKKTEVISSNGNINEVEYFPQGNGKLLRIERFKAPNGHLMEIKKLIELEK